MYKFIRVTYFSHPLVWVSIRSVLFTGQFSDRTLTNCTLFLMASVRCDFRPQSVWSVFACGQKKMCAVGKNDTDRTKKSIFYVGIVL
jgi:hypothetical protein